jgi:hypothetical protein
MADEKVPGDPTEQHPALAGDKAAEVDARSADGSEGTTFLKTFIMDRAIPRDHSCHKNNAIRVVEEALQRGLHPKGHVQLAGHEQSEPDRRGKVNTTCTYSVEVEPAVTDTEAHKTVTPSSHLNKHSSADH